MASPALEKKPPQSAGGTGVRCFCNSVEAEHPTRHCKLFQPRPCTCGHPYSLHAGRCKDTDCKCRSYREDGTAEYLLRAGINAGNWAIAAIPQIAALMRPDNPDPTTRVWACVMVHVLDRRNGEPKIVNGRKVQRIQARLATKQFLADPQDEKSWKSRPLLPDDIMKELNALDQVPRIDRWIVRREIRELERRGALRQVGKIRKNVRLFAYLRPLRSRELPELPDSPEPNLVVCTDHQIPGSPTEQRDLRETLRSHICGVFVKTFRGGLRKLAETENLVVSPDHEKIIGDAAAEIDLVVQRAYQRMGLVVCSEAIYKEDSNTSSKAGGRVERSAEEPASQPPPPPEDPLITALVSRGFGYIEARDLAELRTRLATTPLDLFFRLVDDRLTRGRIGIPILLDKATQARKTYDREKTHAQNGKRNMSTSSPEPESPVPDPDADPIVSSHVCKDCGGVIETYRSRNISQCACALRRRSAEPA